MNHFRRFVADAHVWALGVVKQYDAFHFLPAPFNGRYLHPVEPFGLEYPVGTFGDGVFKRVAALGHAYHYVMFLEFGDVCGAAILTPAVGVVYKPGGGIIVNRLESHPQRL